ncbi:transposase domain-containing protein [Glutamicibacter sp. PAEs-4]|uniref:transposase domain-containing protein n=1 Tax=Glutamicibacter sp. PAEs-4 TaxID=3444114 RepID=UPI003EB72DFB
MSSSHPGPSPAESSPSHDAWVDGHLEDLSNHLLTELVDEALNEAGAVQKRCRSIPSRVVVYFVIALSLFTTLGYGQVFTKLGLGGRTLTTVSA